MSQSPQLDLAQPKESVKLAAQLRRSESEAAAAHGRVLAMTHDLRREEAAYEDLIDRCSVLRHEICKARKNEFNAETKT